MRSRLLFLTLHLFVNLAAVPMILQSGELIGDARGHLAPNAWAVIAAAALICTSYLLLLGPVFSVVNRLHVRPLFPQGLTHSTVARIGIVILVLQAGFMVFNLASGVNVAGATSTKSGSSLSLLWVAIPPDLLFFIYYATCRDARLFKPNLALWTVSNLLRGWSGIFFVIVFFELERAWRKGRITTSRIVLWTAIIFAAYPLITSLKWAIRATAGSGISVSQAISAADSLGLEFDLADMLMLERTAGRVIERLQTVSPLLKVVETAPVLQSKLQSGGIMPFWAEGLVGIAVNRVLGQTAEIPVGVAITDYADLGDPEDIGNWNVNVAYVGWFFIYPMAAPIYISYTLLLCAASAFLVKQINAGADGQNGLWLAWLLYLLPAWWGAFVGYVYALCVFVALAVLLNKVPRAVATDTNPRRSVEPPGAQR